THHLPPPAFPTRRSSDLCSSIVPMSPVRNHPPGQKTPSLSFRQYPDITWGPRAQISPVSPCGSCRPSSSKMATSVEGIGKPIVRSEEHTSELQSRENLVC